MAALGTLRLAAKLLLALDAPESHADLASQADDCVGIVHALGYHALGDHLRQIAKSAPNDSSEADR